ncbi:hypothetical protein LO80_01595 [Candidatus Francisella endociliophora]|uniref:Type VI secretion protein n=1 Tax=Candidatus Francisella endociliophora TaxID=653937 RepID=A0A097EMJ9_9GAMM|nr:type VI secretion system baseplate subunit TssF [Francisella sp. FSC1006]AIT08796.1 hypothetical protein LO80_01595 [Francisella sp. FSC1006]
MSFQDVYEKELIHIRNTAKEYAKNFPNIAPFLENHSQDQDVERMIEAFAFLTAKVQKRIDDGIPELSQNILQTIWPKFLQPYPSVSILKFGLNDKPKEDKMTMPAGKLISGKYKEANLSFRTFTDVDIYPINLVGVKSDLYNNKEIVDLEFNTDYQMSLFDFEDIKLPLYIVGNQSTSLLIAYLLKKKIIKLDLLDSNNKKINSFDASMTEGDLLNMVSVENTQPDIFRLITHYFRYPDLFNYVNLQITRDKNFKIQDIRKFKLRITIELDGIEYIPMTMKNFELYTTPIINIEKASIAPIHYNSKYKNHKLRLDDSSNKAICRLTKVSSLSKNSSRRQQIHLWNDFESAFNDKPLYKQLIINNAINGSPEFNLNFESNVLDDSYISIEGESFCLNTHEIVSEGDICSTSNKLSYTYKNITHVTAPIIPDFADSNLWQLLNYFSVRLNNLNNVEALRQLIVLFNDIQLYRKSQQKSLTQKVCNAIKRVNLEIEQEYHKGRVIRGNVIELTINEQSFLNEGDLYLFGSILNKIYSSLADVNSYNRLKIVGMEKGAVMEWQACLN